MRVLIMAIIIYYLAITGLGSELLNEIPETLIKFFNEHISIKVDIK